jgi:hypothetical protein
MSEVVHWKSVYKLSAYYRVYESRIQLTQMGCGKDWQQWYIFVPIFVVLSIIISIFRFLLLYLFLFVFLVCILVVQVGLGEICGCMTSIKAFSPLNYWGGLIIVL